MAVARSRLFADDWLITHDYEEELLGVVKEGKESEVRLVARSSGERTCYIAEKLFKARSFRGFRDDSGYREDWFTGPGSARARRAVTGHTRMGRKILEAAWYGHEWSELRRLHEAGVTVPAPVEEVAPSSAPSRSFHWRPINASLKGSRDEGTEGGYRMAFVGDPPVAAPRLASVRLPARRAREIWGDLLEEVALMLRAGRVHGDLSAYNVLYWRERAVVIDLSQTVDVITNSAARQLLRRDIDRLASYFRRAGVDA
ncbi:MAG TPA: RIO1 family regulatory kinase/ATPase, partial [Candidatus Thermoplasmatota archaeon]|nr:RIO1 family regulatory kinase/ATPase [Candidatus Thermoplasmatota archaeon]